MALEPTLDPAVWIEDRGVDAAGVPFVRYINTEARRWIVRGECNRCGLCVIGVVPRERFAWDGLPGTPGAVRDLDYGSRLDEPVTPEFIGDMHQMAEELSAVAIVDGCSLAAEIVPADTAPTEVEPADG